MFIAIGIGLCLAATYAAGGTKSGLSQLFYLPIFLAAAAYGPIVGALAGAISGVLCSLVPLDVAERLGQGTGNWLVRLAAFVIAGAIGGMLARRFASRVEQLERLNGQVVDAFERAIGVMHHYTAEHSASVAEHALAIAQQLQLDQATVVRVRGAALLHDIGKLAVPAAILDKPGPLSPSEWAIVHGHVEASLAIVGGIEEFQPYLDGIRHHHERYDGAGYPDGLRGEEIPLEARIIAVADAYDAMTSERSYRQPLPNRAALAVLKDHAGAQFDPEIVEAFITVQHVATKNEPVTPHQPTQQIVRPQQHSTARSDRPTGVATG